MLKFINLLIIKCRKMAEIEFCAVSGYDEVGKNMNAVRVDDEVVIMDMGLQLDNYIKTVGDEDAAQISAKQLIKNKAIPDDSVIQDWRNKVKAIVLTHAHLDHIGAVPYLANKYSCPIFATSYTIEVLKSICRDNNFHLRNKLIKMSQNSKYRLSDSITIEFVNVTHSVPETIIAAIHTPEGKILYANDYKFDMFPTFGKKTPPERFRKLGKVLALIVDSLYAKESIKTPSESVAKDMLKDVMIGVSSEGKAVIVTTFSSHIARLKAIIEYGRQMNRKIVFLGRSLAKYVQAAEKINLVNFSKDVEIVKYGNQIKTRLKQLQKDKHKYLFVVTGHQGEPKSVLTKIATGVFDFSIDKGDLVIFSCKVIPSPINQANRAALEAKLTEKGARLFKDIHVSGHGAREDHREIIEMTKPGHIIPTHGDIEMRSALIELASEMGYELEKDCHLLMDGKRIILSSS
jgi:ribonuclease J